MTIRVGVAGGAVMCVVVSIVGEEDEGLPNYNTSGADMSLEEKEIDNSF